MKLTEFLNDDNCQIFLAIIVCIVVCYFIFGSCGTCKDGFSVGGPCMGDDGTESGCIRHATEENCQTPCRWVDSRAPAPPPPPPPQRQ